MRQSLLRLRFAWLPILLLGSAILLAEYRTTFQVTTGGQVREITVTHRGPTALVVDTDHNGLPDAWEQLYFHHLGVDPLADPDGDGIPNILEQQYGTNPTASDRPPDGTGASLDATPVGAASYTLLDLASSDQTLRKLANGGWVATNHKIFHGGAEVTLPSGISDITSVNSQGQALIRLYTLESESYDKILDTTTGSLTTLQFGMIGFNPDARVMSENFVAGTSTWHYEIIDTGESQEFITDADGAIWGNDGRFFRKLGTAYISHHFSDNLSRVIPYTAGDAVSPYRMNDNGDVLTYDLLGVRQLNGQLLSFTANDLNNSLMLIGEKDVDGHTQGGWWLAGQWHSLGSDPLVPVALNNRGDFIAFMLDPVFETVPVVGYLYRRTGPADPDYEKIPLDGLMPPGWQIDYLRLYAGGGAQLNDDGTIAINALHQAVDASGNPVGATESRLVLLQPAFPEIAVDANRDGTIKLASEDASDATSAALPYRASINDDFEGYGDFKRPDVDPIPDFQRAQVAGVYDLEDYFPVFLNIKDLVRAFPPEDGVSYKLKQADSAVKIVYTQLTRATAFDYNKSPYAYSAADTYQITDTGFSLDREFLNRIKDGEKGVLLVEGTRWTTKPLVLVVEKRGVDVAELSLPLSIGQDILLLLHGMNSNTDTWKQFVDENFPTTAQGPGYMDIRDRDFVPSATYPSPVPNARGVRCYRLQFGALETIATARTGLEGLTAARAEGGIGDQLKPYLQFEILKCGDFETFTELGTEVRDAIDLLLQRHPNARIVLLGHSRGGLSARAFLQQPSSSPAKAAVVGLLTTASPHLGSRLARIYRWLEDHPRPPSPPFGDDWEAVDFLKQPTAFWTTKSTIDVRRPVIKDVSDQSAVSGEFAIGDLNNSSNVANLPAVVRYGEIVYKRVDLGVMVLEPVRYSAFDVAGIDIGKQFSSDAESYILGAGNTVASFPGDGLIPAGNQAFTQLAGFPPPPPGISTNKIPRLRVEDRDVVHTGAPSQTSDLYSQLHVLVPAWFP